MGLKTMGVVQLGHHIIRVLDLHDYFSDHRQNFSSQEVRNLPAKSTNHTFLVITRDQEGELCGIAVDEPPEIVKIPQQMVRSLPKSNIYSKNILNIATHAAILSQEDDTKTIFVLNLKQALNTTITL
jgi:purine-binding chemotaxis protein CheW